MTDVSLTTNPYSPPVAAVADAADLSGQSSGPYFHVAVWKLVIMSVVTVGFYLLYWHYRHWKAIKQDRGENLWPIPRAIFYPLTGFDLYPRFHQSAEGTGINPSWGPMFISISIFSLNILNHVSSWIDMPILSYSFLLQIIPTAVVQSTVNTYQESTYPDAPKNSRLNIWNILWIVLATIILGLAFLGGSGKG